jgi:two-component system response regulator GlrR
MAPTRCLVFARNADAEVAAALRRALAPWPGLAPEPLRSLAAVPADCALLVACATPANAAAMHTALQRVAREQPTLPMLALCCGLADSQLAQWLPTGVREFAMWPCGDGELSMRIAHALGRPPGTGDAGTAALADVRRCGFIGCSPAFNRVLQQLPAIAGCDAGVLIVGETGTGKELFARAVHYLSARAGMPCVAVNCGAVPADLVEAELFGHVRGAYTTAHASRHGLVKEAEGGTLFLDDVDGLPLAAQASLLRFLQEHEYRAVGSNQLQHANVRVVAASNRDLGALARAGTFRPDLYFRLKVLTLTLPPLRERHADIAELARHFCERFARQYQRPCPGLSAQALQHLLGYDWPGNVRELEHVVERAVLLGRTTMIEADELDLPLAAGTDAMHDGDSFQAQKARLVADFERQYIEQLLAQCEGNVSLAAREAKKNRRAFFALMRKHHIEAGRFRAAKPG